MGYFNFWYNFKYFLRRMPKKILVAICIFLIICIAHLKGYCVDHVIVDNLPNYDCVQFTIDKLQRDFDILLYQQIKYAKANNNTFTGTFRNFINNITRPNLGFWVATENQGEYFGNVSGNLPLYTYYGFVALNQSYTETTITNYQSGNSSLSSAFFLDAEIYPNGYISYIQFDTSGNVVSNSGSTRDSITIAVGCNKMLRTDQWETVYAISNGTFSFDSTETLLNNINQNIEEMNDNLADLNNYLQDDTTSQYTSQDLPSDSMNDITASGFNNIFTRIYNSVTSNTNQTVTITIPYLDYPVSVNSYFIYNTLTNNGFGAIITIIDTVYFGLVSLYIIKDIYKYINQIKNGDIGHTDTNIKTEVL